MATRVPCPGLEETVELSASSSISFSPRRSVSRRPECPGSRDRGRAPRAAVHPRSTRASRAKVEFVLFAVVGVQHAVRARLGGGQPNPLGQSRASPRCSQRRVTADRAPGTAAAAAGTSIRRRLDTPCRSPLCEAESSNPSSGGRPSGLERCRARENTIWKSAFASSTTAGSRRPPRRSPSTRCRTPSPPHPQPTDPPPTAAHAERAEDAQRLAASARV